MEEADHQVPTEKSAEFKAAVAEEVNVARLSIAIRSRFVAGVVCCLATLFLSYTSNFDGLGAGSNIWSAVIGFVLGVAMGERVVFFLLGCLVTWIILTKHGA